MTDRTWLHHQIDRLSDAEFERIADCLAEVFDPDSDELTEEFVAEMRRRRAAGPGDLLSHEKVKRAFG